METGKPRGCFCGYCRVEDLLFQCNQLSLNICAATPSLDADILSNKPEKSHTFLLAYFLTCLVACLPTHLFAYTDDRVMLLSFITGLSPQIIKNTKSYYFFPNIMQQCFFFWSSVFFFSDVFIKKAWLPGGDFALYSSLFYRKALFPRMK